MIVSFKQGVPVEIPRRAKTVVVRRVKGRLVLEFAWLPKVKKGEPSKPQRHLLD